jgi:3-hydroxyisobutyrate dehydrogenase
MVQLQQKDLRLALAAARRLGVPLPATALVHQLFTALETRGGGALGTQALVTALERLAGGENDWVRGSDQGRSRGSDFRLTPDR